MLGVAPDASYEELKKAYAAKAFRLHPDRHPDASTEERAAREWRMRELNAAWAVLRDTARRAAYDEELARQRRAAEQVRTRPPSWAPADPGRPAGGAGDLPDLEADVVQVRGERTVLRFAPVAVLAVVLLAILIVSAYASSGGEADRGLITTERAPVGSCVQLSPRPSDPDEAATARSELIEVDCRRPGARLVVAKVAMNQVCPAGSTAHPAGEVVVCLRG